MALTQRIMRPLSFALAFNAILFAVIWYIESGKEERCFRQHFETARERKIFFEPDLRWEVLRVCSNNPSKLLNSAARDTWKLALDATSPTELKFRVQLYLAMFGDLTPP